MAFKNFIPLLLSLLSLVDLSPACTPVQNNCPMIQNDCYAIQNGWPEIQYYYPVVQNDCPVVQNDCPVVQNDCPAVQNNRPVIQNDCPAVQNNRPVIQNDCPAVQNGCSATQNGYLGIQNNYPANNVIANNDIISRTALRPLVNIGNTYGSINSPLLNAITSNSLTGGSINKTPSYFPIWSKLMDVTNSVNYVLGDPLAIHRRSFNY